jgi:hypothetical protein
MIEALHAEFVVTAPRAIAPELELV